MLDEVTWVVPGKILCAQFSGTVSRAQIQQMNENCVDVLRDYTDPASVHLIIDVSTVVHYERDNLRADPTHEQVKHHPALDWIVIVDPYPNAIVRFVGLTLISLMKYRYHITKSRAEAIAFIVPHLPQSPA
jgi:hypothetical protein